MHAETFQNYQHEHVFLGADHRKNERKTWVVIGLCGAMMLGEIGGGLLFHSMALLADGLHMSTHAGALLIAAGAYTYARRHARDPRFTFGTGKLGDLAAFTSAVVLAMIAMLIAYESINRFLHPIPIAFDQAIPVAVLGLCVNVASAWLLKDDHDHGHSHAGREHHDEVDDHDHDHDHDGHVYGGPHKAHDLNLRAAYVHVLADAAVSVLAITGLLAGRQLGWTWMDPLMGLVGALVIANWSSGLVRAAGGVLLDMRPKDALPERIGKLLETNGDRVADLHVWQVGPGHSAAVVTVVSDHPEAPNHYKERLSKLPGLSHVTVEVHACRGHQAA